MKGLTRYWPTSASPNAMTRSIRNKYLEPIGVAEVNGSFGLKPKLDFGWFVAKTVIGSWFPTGDLSGVENRFAEKDRYVRRALKRNRVLGRRILMIIARYQKSFTDQSFLLGDEGGVFDQLCHNLASLCFVVVARQPGTRVSESRSGTRFGSRPENEGTRFVFGYNKAGRRLGV